jgi:hypothetical protein
MFLIYKKLARPLQGKNKTSPESFPSHIKMWKQMYEFVTLYCVSGILVLHILHILDTCSIISKYTIKIKIAKEKNFF